MRGDLPHTSRCANQRNLIGGRIIGIAFWHRAALVTLLRGFSRFSLPIVKTTTKRAAATARAQFDLLEASVHEVQIQLKRIHDLMYVLGKINVKVELFTGWKKDSDVGCRLWRVSIVSEPTSSARGSFTLIKVNSTFRLHHVHIIITTAGALS
jgi:hypothetical protein